MSFRKTALLIPSALLLLTAVPVHAAPKDGASSSSSHSGPGSSSSGSDKGGSSGGSSGGTAVPEPADLALFAAGIVGLLVGRQTSRKRAVPKAEK